jgi:hypothetical protein
MGGVNASHLFPRVRSLLCFVALAFATFMLKTRDSCCLLGNDRYELRPLFRFVSIAYTKFIHYKLMVYCFLRIPFFKYSGGIGMLWFFYRTAFGVSIVNCFSLFGINRENL